METVKRNSYTKTDPDSDSAAGVGARQTGSARQPEGGGYQDICAIPEFPETDRCGREELRRMGLSRMWLEVSDVVGPDQFLAIWRVIDRHAVEDYGNLRIRIPRFTRFLRYQRNRYIRTLAQSGHSVTDIHRRLRRELGVRLHVESVRKLVYRLR